MAFAPDGVQDFPHRPIHDLEIIRPSDHHLSRDIQLPGGMKSHEIGYARRIADAQDCGDARHFRCLVEGQRALDRPAVLAEIAVVDARADGRTERRQESLEIGAAGVQQHLRTLDGLRQAVFVQRIDTANRSLRPHALGKSMRRPQTSRADYDV
jgi:hypothetical protein